jgi:hypothetical protein
MKQQINRERREYANSIAQKVAQILGKTSQPKCDRITRRRGFAKIGGSRFSVPSWAFEKIPEYRDYYIIHEALHCLTGLRDGNPNFRIIEKQVNLLHSGCHIEYKGHYASKLVDASGIALCGKAGGPVCG